MIEYIYNAIKATAGEDITIAASITDDNNQPITSGCNLLFIDKDFVTIGEYKGTYVNDVWNFTIPAEVTKDMNGRYWYRIRLNDDSLSFSAPIYIGR